MNEISAQAATRTVLCPHPACTEEAEAGRSTCRRHRADRGGPIDPATLAAAAEADGRLCKVSGCPGEPVVARGPFAGLCREHADLKRSAHGSRIAHGMQAAGEGSPRRPVTTPLGVVKALQQTARDLERAQARYDTAKAELNRARRAWKTALQDAAVSS